MSEENSAIASEETYAQIVTRSLEQQRSGLNFKKLEEKKISVVSVAKGDISKLGPDINSNEIGGGSGTRKHGLRSTARRGRFRKK